ncbi:MAG TPA: hypothetical protein VHS54_06825 [Jatrophihabitans sp.]|nr:hypothetical protein [Jatrophihabitans sp.]
MNTYVANNLARDHVDSLVASAAAYRRAKEARQGRRVYRAQPGHLTVGRARRAASYVRG